MGIGSANDAATSVDDNPRDGVGLAAGLDDASNECIERSERLCDSRVFALDGRFRATLRP